MSSMLDHYEMLAEYNASANRRLYEACGQLSDTERKKDRGAFFDSIHGTLNHIMIGDRIWLRRFQGESVPSNNLDEILYETFEELHQERKSLDQALIDFVDDLTSPDLKSSVTYTNNEGLRYQDPIRLLLPHLFNHQTHHRGQVHEMICRTDVEPPVLDLHRVVKPDPDK